MFESIKNKRIFVVVAHPDDELLGCGATMHRLIHEQDCTIRAVILGEGLTSRSETRDSVKWKEDIEVQRTNIENARKVIGYDSEGIYDFPDNRFDSVDLLDIIKVIEKEKKEFKPEIIFTHHGGDLNIDHRKVFEAVMTATRPMEHEVVKTIVSFETPSGTEWQASSDPRRFIPNLFVKISNENLQTKINGLECYEYEKRPYPHPRSPEALRIRAQMWGVSNGMELAEAFYFVRGFA